MYSGGFYYFTISYSLALWCHKLQTLKEKLCHISFLLPELSVSKLKSVFCISKRLFQKKSFKVEKWSKYPLGTLLSFLKFLHRIETQIAYKVKRVKKTDTNFHVVHYDCLYKIGRINK